MTGSNNIILRKLDAGDADDIQNLQHILLSVPDYWQRIWGEQPKDDAAQETFRMLPPDLRDPDSKMIYGIFEDDRIVGCIDLVQGWPDSNTMMIGLLIITPTRQRRGIGKHALFQVEQMAKDLQLKKLRLGVIATNDHILPLYQMLGFSETGRKPFFEKQVRSEAIILEKLLP